MKFKFTANRIGIKQLNMIAKYLNYGKKYSIHDEKTVSFKQDLLVRLYYDLEIDEKGCWLIKNWSDYSHLTYDGKNWPAHRLSYQLFHKDLKDNLFVCHKCDRKGCRNPNHLFQGTHLDNLCDYLIKTDKKFKSMDPDVLLSYIKFMSQK